MRVLVTRPAQDGERTAEALRSAGHEAVLSPLFVVQRRSHALPEGIDAFAATSANALRHAALEAAHFALPLFAVGDATAAEARTRGFRDVRSAGGSAEDLAALLDADPPPLRGRAGRGSGETLPRLAYLAGRPRRDAALAALEGRFDLHLVETYETVALDALPSVAAEALAAGRIDAALHLSPRAAEVFEALAVHAGLREASGRLLHVCISDAAARPSFLRQVIAARPNLAAMIAALDALGR